MEMTHNSTIMNLVDIYDIICDIYFLYDIMTLDLKKKWRPFSIHSDFGKMKEMCNNSITNIKLSESIMVF